MKQVNKKMGNKTVKTNNWDVFMGTNYLSAINWKDHISVNIGLGSKIVRINNLEKNIILEIDIDKMEIKKESEE